MSVEVLAYTDISSRSSFLSASPCDTGAKHSPFLSCLAVIRAIIAVCTSSTLVGRHNEEKACVGSSLEQVSEVSSPVPS